MKNYESLSEALEDLKKRGYEADFATQTVCLYCGDLDMRLDPEDFHVDEIYRFGDGSTPDVYAISSTSGVKGTFVDAYGNYSSGISFEMAEKLGSNALSTW